MSHHVGVSDRALESTLVDRGPREEVVVTVRQAVDHDAFKNLVERTRKQEQSVLSPAHKRFAESQAEEWTQKQVAASKQVGNLCNLLENSKKVDIHTSRF